MDKKKSLALWKEYGRYIFMATQYQDWVLESGQGSVIKDLDGNEFLDMASGQICSILGHNHPEFMERIIGEMQKVLHSGTTFLSPPVFEASAKLAEITPGALNRSILLSTGAEANEFAFRVAKAYTGKSGIVGLTKGYAGLTLATTSVTNYGKGAFPHVPDTFFLLTPQCSKCPVESRYPECDVLCLDVSEENIKGARERIAAFIVEPILSAGGMIVPPPDYFKRLRQLADRYEALIIADEAQTGLGRTGKWFGMEHFGVVPDILVVSKGVGGGFPSSGVITTEEIADRVQGRVTNFSSHQSDPVAAAAVSAVIDIIKKEDLVERAREKGNYLMTKLRDLSGAWTNITNVRGLGLMIGFDLQQRDPINIPVPQLGPLLEYTCRKNGVHMQCIQKGETFRILPSLTIQYNQLDQFIKVLDCSLQEIRDRKVTLEDAFPENPYTQELNLRRRKGLQELVAKAWEMSPKEWVEKVKRKLKE